MNYIYKTEVRDGHDYVDMSTVMEHEEFERLKAIFIDIWERVIVWAQTIFDSIYDKVSELSEHYSIEEIAEILEADVDDFSKRKE